MATVPQKTLNWLYDVLKREYHDPNRTYSDLAQTLAQHPSLAPRTDVYTADNGAPALLLNLKGTLPVNFRGTTYRFPIALWIPHAYPYEAPIAYVSPTEDMMVRPGQHVSASDGKIYHQYLAKWREVWDRSSVVEFLQILADVFSKEPPVMAKSQQMPSQQQQQQQQQQYARPPPVPPLPQDPRRYSSQQPHPGSPNRNIPAVQPGLPPPPPPPPPKQATQASYPGSAGPPSPAPKPGRYDAPPPLPTPNQPARPSPAQQPNRNGSAQQPSGPTQYLPQRTSSLRQEYPPHSQLPHPQQYQPQSPGRPLQTQGPLPPVDSQRYNVPPQPPPQNYNQPSFHQHGSPVTHPSASPQIQQQYPGQSSQFQSPPIQQQHQNQRQPPAQNWQSPQAQAHQVQQTPVVQPPKLSQPKDLLSEDDPFQVSLSTKAEDSNIPAPPIPTNPEKTALLSHLSILILQRLHTNVSQTQTSALPSLQSQHAALSSASQTLQTETQHLQTLSSQLQSNISALQSTINSANDTIRSTQDKKHPSHPENIPAIDQIIIPPTVVARQLYDAVAEQRGYEAAIFALNEAFVRGRIGSEVWGRKVRECAREEMRRKWLVRKIGEGLGLEEY